MKGINKLMVPKPIYKKRKPPKIPKIKLQIHKVCYMTGSVDGLEEHHIFYGPLRRKSELYGLKVWLRHELHRGDDGMHFNKELDLILKRMAQQRFEEVYGHQKFMEEFGRNYL